MVIHHQNLKFYLIYVFCISKDSHESQAWKSRKYLFAREIAQWVKHLLQKHKDQSPEPSIHRKSRMHVPACLDSLMETGNPWEKVGSCIGQIGNLQIQQLPWLIK